MPPVAAVRIAQDSATNSCGLATSKAGGLVSRLNMKPEHKFHSYVTAATVSAMYFVITDLLPLIQLNSTLQPYAQWLGALLLSLGIYKALATTLLGTARTLKFVKRHLLGPSYVNGTWIGEFTKSDGSKVVTVEHFEQTLSSLKIRGRAYEPSGSYAHWQSVAETIDEITGTLTYTYTCERDGPLQGICVFQFDRKDETSGPTGIHGYSADLVDGIRTVNTETRLSEDLLPFDEARRKAQESGGR